MRPTKRSIFHRAEGVGGRQPLTTAGHAGAHFARRHNAGLRRYSKAGVLARNGLGKSDVTRRCDAGRNGHACAPTDVKSLRPLACFLNVGTFLLLAAFASASFAATNIYISSQGDDANAGHATTEPVKSIDRAIELLKSDLGNDDCTLHLGPGRYDVHGLTIDAGQHRLTVVGTRGKRGGKLEDNTVVVGPIAVRGRPMYIAKLFLTVDQKTDKPILDVTDSAWVKIEDCLFSGSAGMGVSFTRSEWVVDCCVFDDIYQSVYSRNCHNGALMGSTVVDDRLGHGTNSLTTARVHLQGGDDFTVYGNVIAPRDADGKSLLLENIGGKFESSHNVWRGVITHQYGTEQQSTWQSNFRTVDAWQAHGRSRWQDGTDVTSRSDPVAYRRGEDGVPLPQAVSVNQAPPGDLGMVWPPADFFDDKPDGHSGALNISPCGSERFVTINFPSAGRASVGLVDKDGDLVQTLAAAQLFSAGKHRFVIDSRTAVNYRALLIPDGPLALDVAGPGMRVAPGCTGTGLANNPQENGQGMWCDGAGNLYRVAFYDEAGSTILATDADGHYRWRNWKVAGTHVAGDDRFIYVIGAESNQKDDVVLRRFKHDGVDPVPWGKELPVYKVGSAKDVAPTGLAVAGDCIYVADGSRDRILVLPIGTSDPASPLHVPSPAGMLVRPDGSVVVACRKHGLVVLRGGTVAFKDDHTFNDVVDVAAGPDGTVLVADGGATQQVLQCKIGQSIEINQRIGRRGGYDGNDPIVRPDRFLPINALASHGNTVWVGQKQPGYARNRLAKFDLSKPASPLIEVLSLEGQNGSFADPRDPSQIYSADLFRYVVHPDGSWIWDRNYQDARSKTVGEQVGCSTGAVFYIKDQKFVATTIANSPTTTTRTVVIYRFDGENLVPCAAVGGRYLGPHFQEKDYDPAKSGQWTWQDANNDGLVQESELSFIKTGIKDGKPFADCTWGTYVERDGTIVWPGEAAHYLRPRGLDKTGKRPVYDWADETTVAYKNFPDRDERYQCRVDTDGTIWDLSTTKSDPMPPGYWGMGTVLTKLSPAGVRLFSIPIDMTAKGLAVNDNYVFVCSCFGPYISQYTKDGLLVRQFSWGKTDSQFGWFDFPTPINAVTDPKTGESVITAEEQWFGRAMVFRVPNDVKRWEGAVP